MKNQELITKAISKLSTEEKALIFPPITRANFVVRKNWLGRNQVITFNTKATKTKPSVKVTYNHDEVLKIMLPKLSIMPCWIKRGYWSQSTDMPSNVRHLSEREETEATKQQLRLPKGKQQTKYESKQIIYMNLKTNKMSNTNLQNKTYFQIYFCSKNKMYDFTIFNSTTHKVIYHYHFTNLKEINKLIQTYK